MDITMITMWNRLRRHLKLKLDSLICNFFHRTYWKIDKTITYEIKSVTHYKNIFKCMKCGFYITD